MIYRTIQDKIVQISKQMPIITLTGPRQSGKTTLTKHKTIVRERIKRYTDDPKRILKWDEVCNNFKFA